MVLSVFRNCNTLDSHLGAYLCLCSWIFNPETAFLKKHVNFNLAEILFFVGPEAATKSSSQKFCKIHRKTLVPESLYLTKLHAEVFNFIKKETLTQGFCYEFCKISKNTFFTEQFRGTTAVGQVLKKLDHLHLETKLQLQILSEVSI